MALNDDFRGSFDTEWEGGEGIGAPGQQRWHVIVKRPGHGEEAFRVSAASVQGALALAQETQNVPGLVYRVTPELA